jgi:hypothetical protein
MNIFNNYYLSIVSIILAVLSMPAYSDIEIPNYKVIEKEKPFEIRLYESMIIAEVTVDANRKKSATKGFKLLADYIFGSNQSQTDIAMTAPVQQQQSEESWIVSFVMPSSFSMDSIPTPTNNLVTIKQVPQKTYAVIQFSGWNTDRNVFKNEKRLREFLRKNNLNSIGNPTFAFYDPPFKLPMFRRNEVMLEVSN